MVLEEKLQLNETNVYNKKVTKVYEKDFSYGLRDIRKTICGIRVFKPNS